MKEVVGRGNVDKNAVQTYKTNKEPGNELTETTTFPSCSVHFQNVLETWH